MPQWWGLQLCRSYSPASQVVPVTDVYRAPVLRKALSWSTVVREGTTETDRNACLPGARILGDTQGTAHGTLECDDGEGMEERDKLRECWVGCGLGWSGMGSLRRTSAWRRMEVKESPPLCGDRVSRAEGQHTHHTHVAHGFRVPNLQSHPWALSRERYQGWAPPCHTVLGPRAHRFPASNPSPLPPALRAAELRPLTPWGTS